MIKDIVFSSIKKHEMPLAGRNVMVCVSGGADSIALLFFLHRHREELAINNLLACHFNHGIRGEESDRDEQFVRDICLRLGIELLCDRGRMSERDRPAGRSEEMWARDLRRAFIDDCCRKSDAVAAMAHTLNDSIETMLFNISRGSGIRGLRGIRPVYKNTVRPFIDVSRDQIEEYCRVNDLEYVTDSSNLSDDYSRNFVRHHLIPDFCSINSGFIDNAKRMMAHVSDAFDYIDAECKRLIDSSRDGNEYTVDNFLSADPYIAKCSIKRLLDERFDMIDEKMVGECLAAVRGQKRAVQIRENAFFSVKNGRFSIVFTDEGSKEPDLPKKRVVFNTPIAFGRFRFVFSLQKTEDCKQFKKSSQNVCINLVDYDKIKGNLFIRGREPGDSFSSPRRGNTKPLKKLFNELKVPLPERDTYPLLADDSGVVWLMGQGAAASASIDKNTKRIIHISLEEMQL